ncbi:unnamed protein product [Rhizoctonia solani]|uniref:MI domain-containing protein n=1 Tax=Rhizoctonia solani TaxID=456999 RepID=A0A8H3B1D5_9AGAM|nr:unnamed protein product [Rhizoctonia solani]CAE6533067.1 unnamed protein product [Rhizoctonia solani]
MTIGNYDPDTVAIAVRRLMQSWWLQVSGILVNRHNRHFWFGPNLIAQTSKFGPRKMIAESAGQSNRRVLDAFNPTDGWDGRGVASALALASARMIEDLNTVDYPETIKRPNPDLTFAVTPGKFRYDREFLLQFRLVCRERPSSLPPLDVIGLELSQVRTGHPSGVRGGRRGGSMGMGTAPSLQRQAPIGLGPGPGLAHAKVPVVGDFWSSPSPRLRFETARIDGSSPTCANRNTSQGGSYPTKSERVHTFQSSTSSKDLSQFGKISKPTGIQFGPSSVFKKKFDSKQSPGSGRPSGLTMFSFLDEGVALSRLPERVHVASGWGTSVDLGPGGSPAIMATGARKKLSFFPKIKASMVDYGKSGGDKAQNRVREDIKEYLYVQSIDEAILTLKSLPSEHRHLFVNKLINAAMDGGDKVVVLAEKLFSVAHTQSIISFESFKRGFLPTIEMADDLSIDVPKTYEWLARMMHAAGMDRSQTEEMATKISIYGEPRVPPRQLLVEAFERVSMSSPLSANASMFVPGNIHRQTNSARTSTPNGDAVAFEGQPASPEVTTPIPPEQQVAVNIIETEQQKDARLAREEEELAERNRWELEGPESLANYDRFIAIARRRVRENIVY